MCNNSYMNLNINTFSPHSPLHRYQLQRTTNNYLHNNLSIPTINKIVCSRPKSGMSTHTHNRTSKSGHHTTHNIMAPNGEQQYNTPMVGNECPHRTTNRTLSETPRHRFVRAFGKWESAHWCHIVKDLHGTRRAQSTGLELNAPPGPPAEAMRRRTLAHLCPVGGVWHATTLHR